MRSDVSVGASIDAALAEPAPVPVLIVDDDRDIRLVMEEVLASPDRELVFAESGEEALRLLRNLTPAAILLDVRMEGMSGFEVARLIRGRTRLASTPIVFMTGVSTDELAVEQGYKLGAVDYLLKPFIPEVLESKVAAFCTLARQRQVLENQRDQLTAAETRLKEANGELARLATTDVLTGLGNRALFDDVLQTTHDRESRTNGGYAAMMIDLDGFKAVNDTLGHAAGDQVLAGVGERLRVGIRTYDLAFRLGGDEFCVLIPGIEPGRDILSFGRRLGESLALPHVVAPGVEVVVPASIGIAMFDPDHPVSPAALMSRADSAMYQAKAEHSGCRIDGEDVNIGAARELEHERAVAEAIGSARASVRFRAIVELDSGNVCGLDALPWLADEDFAGTFADSGLAGSPDPVLLRDLSRVVFEEALRQWASVRDQVGQGQDPSLGLHVDYRAWVGPDLLEFLTGQIETGHVEAPEITLWVPEHAVPLAGAELLATIQELSRMGVRIGIDQVGRAFPLMSLGQWPVSLVRTGAALLTARNAQPLAAVAGLAGACGIVAIGCGVSTPEQLQLLRECGFTIGQGELLGELIASDQATPPPAHTGSRMGADREAST